MTAANDRSWLALWLALAAVPFAFRGPIPTDELRYLSVAWEMWQRGDFIVPHLNGLPYPDKPPLLFWLMHAGWTLFGVGSWWPRLLPALAALVAVLLTRRLGRELWPDRPAVAARIPWLLLGSLAWTVYSQLILFDLLIVDCALLGLLGFVRAAAGNCRGWWLVAASAALGILSKGPVILLHLAGPGLLAFYWTPRERFRAARWYGLLGVALLGGCLVALAWALLAASRGGQAYSDDLLLGQTAGRLVKSFSHARPFWFYLWMVPLMLTPWTLWPAGWRAVRRAGPSMTGDRGRRTLLTAIVPAFVVFSAISGKQPHYLLPVVPALLLLLARMLPEDLALRPVKRLALVVPIVLLAVEAAYFTNHAASFDLRPAAREARRFQDEGHPLAFVGVYQGEFHFLGRLSEPLEELDYDGAEEWAAAHPDGYVFGATREPQAGAIYTQPIRNRLLAIRPSSAIVAPGGT